MSSPKHLWTGDWEQESEEAARARERLRPDLAQPEPEPEPAPSFARAVSQPRQRLAPRIGPFLRGLARRLVPRREQLRLFAIVAALVVVVAGAAFGISRIGGNGSGAASPTTGHAWLGVQMGVLPTGAVVVTSVTPGSPANSGGLHVGDVIAEVESRPVGAPVDVTDAVNALSPGDSVELIILRGSSTQTVRVKLAAPPSGSP